MPNHMTVGYRICRFLMGINEEDPGLEAVVMDDEVTVIDSCPRCGHTRKYRPNKKSPFGVRCGGCGKLGIMVPRKDPFGRALKKETQADWRRHPV